MVGGVGQILAGVFGVGVGVEVTSPGVGVLVEGVFVGVDGLVGEVENCRGVDGVSHEAGFEVEVGAEGAAGVAAEGDGFAGFHILIVFHKEFREVTVYGFEAVGVTEDYVVAVAFALEVGQTYAAVEGSADGVAGLQFQVNALVDAAETGTVTVGGCHVAGGRHGEPADVNDLGVRHFLANVSVDAAGVPSFGVDIQFGFFLLFEEVVDEVLSFLYGNLLLDVFLFGDEILVLGVVGGGEFV